MPEPLIRLLHAAYAAPADGVTDADLVARIAAGPDDAAFELLVRRHAALVWRVCRSVTRDHHAAEDAFQAAFLALATKAGTVRGSVAGWLYRVAYHAALKAKGRRIRPALPFDPEAPDRAADGETAALLHAELNALPEKYRVPVVLCHLHGFTQAEAAKQLGLPVGTVATRVRRGLDRLRDRLTRRGVAVPAVAAALFAADADAVSPDLVTAAGRVSVTPPADLFRLAEGAVAAMTPFRWKPVAALTAAALGLTLAAGALVSAGHTPAAPQAKPDDKPAAAPKPATFSQSQKSRDNLRRVVVAIHGYMDEHNEVPKDIKDATGRPVLSWRVAILPYLDLEFLHAQFKLDEPWDGPNNRKLLAFMPGVFRAPVQAPKAADTFIQAISGPETVFDPRAKVSLYSITDGTSNTLMLAETGPAVPWTKPADVPFSPDGKPPVFASPYTDAVHIATADGATYRMTTKPDEERLRAIITRNGGEVFNFNEIKASPAKPTTNEDRKQLAERKAYAAKRLIESANNAEDRFKCEQELRKLGDPPQPDPSKVETLEEMEELMEAIERRSSADRHEYYRLIEEVRKVAPKAADRIELGRQQRVIKR